MAESHRVAGRTAIRRDCPVPIPPPFVANLADARLMIAELTERNCSQSHLLQAWKQRLKQQNEMLLRLHREREEQMRLLTSQLLLLEANLRAKQSKIDGLLNQRDRIISGQQETVRTLERELEKWRNKSRVSADPPVVAVRPQTLSLTTSRPAEDEKTDKAPVMTPLTSTPIGAQHHLVRVLGREQGDESLDDSDSAVVIDDHHRHSPTFNSQQIKVIRSISDVVDSSRSIYRDQPGILKSTRLVRNQQRRVMFQQEPEVVEDEEDAGEEEDEVDGSSGTSSSDDSPFNRRGNKTFLRGSFERMPVQQQDSGGGRGLSSSSLRAASRCSNHRSVIRPRDVKFKRNNKCLWKSLDGCASSPTLPANREFQTSFPHLV